MLRKKILFLILIICVAIYFFFGQSIWFMFTAKGYQAVFLENSQVYFGKISTSGHFFKLTDIYYLRGAELSQQGATDSSQNIELIKLGNELHGPTDTMYIKKDRILFWENLKDDSKVVEAIKKYQSK